jgi:hypothetical protein
VNHRPGFAAKRFQSGRIVSDALGKKLESDEAALAGVLGFVDYAHATAANLLQYAVM